MRLGLRLTIEPGVSVRPKNQHELLDKGKDAGKVEGKHLPKLRPGLDLQAFSNRLDAIREPHAATLADWMACELSRKSWLRFDRGIRENAFDSRIDPNFLAELGADVRASKRKKATGNLPVDRRTNNHLRNAIALTKNASDRALLIHMARLLPKNKLRKANVFAQDLIHYEKS